MQFLYEPLLWFAVEINELVDFSRCIRFHGRTVIDETTIELEQSIKPIESVIRFRRILAKPSPVRSYRYQFGGVASP